MGKPLNYVSIDLLLNKVSRDLGITDVPVPDLINWAAEALEFMSVSDNSEDAVAFIEVKNYTAELPYGLKQIIQVARNHNFDPKQKNICPAEICYDRKVEEIIEPKKCDKCSKCKNCKESFENNPCDCDNTTLDLYCDGIPLDCHGKPIYDRELAYYRPYWDISYNNKNWKLSRTYTSDYTPMRLSNHSFFNSLVCYDKSEIYESDADEYTIMGNTLRTSFKEGSIAISYKRILLDEETGYPMIPDDISFTTAITKYILMMWSYRQIISGREGYERIYAKSEQDWQWYCNQAKTKSFALHGIDEHENFTALKMQMNRRRNSYYKFFGNLNRPR